MGFMTLGGGDGRRLMAKMGKMARGKETHSLQLREGNKATKYWGEVFRKFGILSLQFVG